MVSGIGADGGAGRNDGIGRVDARGAQENEEFAGPEQNVQQAPALKIREFFGMQADVQSLARTFLDERAHGREIRGSRREPPAAGIHGFEFLVAVVQEVVQAKILFIQRNNRGAATRNCAAVSFPRHWTHRPHDRKLQFAAVLIVRPVARPKFIRRGTLPLPADKGPGDKGAPL